MQVQESLSLTKTTFRLEELAYRWFLRDNGRISTLNPDGTIPKNIKESVGYMAFRDVFNYASPDNLKGYIDGSSWTPEQKI